MLANVAQEHLLSITCLTLPLCAWNQTRDISFKRPIPYQLFHSNSQPYVDSKTVTLLFHCIQLLQEEYKFRFGRENETTPYLTDDQTRLLWSVTVSVFGAGGVIGGFAGSYIATTLGRCVFYFLPFL